MCKHQHLGSTPLINQAGIRHLHGPQPKPSPKCTFANYGTEWASTTVYAKDGTRLPTLSSTCLRLIFTKGVNGSHGMLTSGHRRHSPPNWQYRRGVGLWKCDPSEVLRDAMSSGACRKLRGEPKCLANRVLLPKIGSSHRYFVPGRTSSISEDGNLLHFFSQGSHDGIFGIISNKQRASRN